MPDLHTHPTKGPPRHDLRKPRIQDDPDIEDQTEDEDLNMTDEDLIASDIESGPMDFLAILTKRAEFTQDEFISDDLEELLKGEVLYEMDPKSKPPTTHFMLRDEGPEDLFT